MTRRPRAVLVLALSLVALFAAVPSRAAVDGPLSAVPCATDAGGVGLPWLATPAGACPIGRCSTVADCTCPYANGASCVNHACSYTYPGGGGGGTNPHGCHAARCSSSADCRCADGTFADCIGNACTF